jgi:hypothetical protein
VSQPDAGQEFWFDRARRLKQQGELSELMHLCIANLPYPAAFRELAIALRRASKNLRQAGEPDEQCWRVLYVWAVYERFLFASPTVTLSPAAGFTEAGRTYSAFNVAELAHRQGAMDRLVADYQTMGYARLSLLNKTDRKRLVERWGEPAQHQDPRQVYQQAWGGYVHTYERTIIAEQESFRDELMAALKRDTDGAGASAG